MKQESTSALLLNMLFWAVSVSHLASIVFNLSMLGYISKPMIMISLGLIFILNDSNDRRIYPLFAILFSWIGDISLMFQQQNEIWFLNGLGAFFAAQVLYVISFRKYQSSSPIRTYPFLKPLIYTALIVYAMILWSKLLPGLGGYQLPVTLYTLAILTMTLVAASRLGRTSLSSFMYGITGAVLFMISDSLIALNKFILPIPNDRILVMSTYILGQYLIIKGLIRHQH